THPPCPCADVITNSNSPLCGICGSPIQKFKRLIQEKLEFADKIDVLSKEADKQADTLNNIKKENEKLKRKVEELEDQLDESSDKQLELQRENEELTRKLKVEIESKERAQLSKDLVTAELEELSKALFEEANGMVKNEKEQRHAVEKSKQYLESQLKESQDLLEHERKQLRELREKLSDALEQPEVHSRRSSIMSSVNLAATSQTIPAIMTEQLDIAALLDPNQISLFRDFLESVAEVSYSKIQTIPYIKSSLTEDIEQCLKFHSNSRVSTRKLVEAASTFSLHIESNNTRSPPTSSSPASSNPASPSKVQTFQDILKVQYTGINSDLPSYPICRFCRDRIVVVCEFFSFVRNIKNGLYSRRGINELLLESTRLKLQMFYAR
ncbi:hypothetical protein BKA69DRAFT_1015414, partial [Paraphysoderma sedebokerense]